MDTECYVTDQKTQATAIVSRSIGFSATACATELYAGGLVELYAEDAFRDFVATIPVKTLAGLKITFSAELVPDTK